MDSYIHQMERGMREHQLTSLVRNLYKCAAMPDVFWSLEDALNFIVYKSEWMGVWRTCGLICSFSRLLWYSVFAKTGWGIINQLVSV